MTGLQLRLFRHSQRSEESPHYSLPNQPLLKSFHVGFSAMIKATFFARSHPLICFLRGLAGRNMRARWRLPALCWFRGKAIVADAPGREDRRSRAKSARA